MRQVILGVVCILTFTCCSDKEIPTVSEEILELGEPAETFEIKNDIGGTINGKNGTQLMIRPNTFIFDDGQEPDESIQIELKEVFDKSDMIMNGLGTTSDGRLLESFGMIHLKATSGKKILRIKDNASISVSIPNKRKGDGGELFYGSQAGDVLNWKYAGPTKDTTEIVERIVPMSDDRVSIKRTTYKVVDGLKVFVSDTVFITNYECCSDSTSTESAATTIPQAYEFELTNLGWINCDRFIDVTDKVDLHIELKNFSQPIGYLVFAQINSVMPILFDENGNALAGRLPNNYGADLIVIDIIDDNIMWIKQSLKIGADRNLILQTKKIEKPELKMELKRIDK